jgi:transcriptional regulator with XRE-family HTH domain
MPRKTLTSESLDGGALREWRKKRSWSAKALAEWVGVSVHAVRSWESGRLSIPIYCERILDLSDSMRFLSARVEALEDELKTTESEHRRLRRGAPADPTVHEEFDADLAFDADREDRLFNR